MVILGKMRPNTLEYVYMVILLVKKDESHNFVVIIDH
jgi:hypothetical protein